MVFVDCGLMMVVPQEWTQYVWRYQFAQCSNHYYYQIVLTSFSCMLSCLHLQIYFLFSFLLPNHIHNNQMIEITHFNYKTRDMSCFEAPKWLPSTFKQLSPSLRQLVWVNLNAGSCNRSCNPCWHSFKVWDPPCCGMLMLLTCGLGGSALLPHPGTHRPDKLLLIKSYERCGTPVHLICNCYLSIEQYRIDNYSNFSVCLKFYWSKPCIFECIFIWHAW